MNSPQNFAAACSQRLPCSRRNYAESVLWHCLPALRKQLARIIWFIKPEFFESDLFLINEVGQATTVGRAREIINFFNHQPAARRFVRHRLKIRLSRTKLLALADEVWRPVKADQAAETTTGPALAHPGVPGLWR